MRRSFILLVFSLWIGGWSLPAQTVLVTHNDFTANTLVKDIFASGACENIDLIQPIGHTAGIGYFENGSASIGLDRGIILSTGPTSNAPGPNSATDRSGDFNDNSGDPDLSSLATGAVRDAVGIEFDFVPLDSFVSFRYVFASEEYCEFVGSEYNDVFGFFISGPGINGSFSDNARNVALIPGSNDYVAINSVNHQHHANFFVRNELDEDQQQCHLDPVSRPHLNDIEYDGFTQVLTAVLRLQPCETYHIRLVVGDVADEFFDSAVFLEAGSFNLGGQVDLVAEGGSAGPDAVYEGCDDGYFRFRRVGEAPNTFPLTVHYVLSQGSTAGAGEDFAPFAGEVTIPAGVNFVDLPVTTFADTLDEGPERLELVLDIPCACYADSAFLWIQPPQVVEATLPDAYVCPGEAAILQASVTQGMMPYTYQWSTGEDDSGITVPALDSVSYQLTITDACEQTTELSALTWLVTPPLAELSGDVTICEGDTAQLPLTLSGTPPFLLHYTLDGVDQPPVSLVAANEYFFPATAEGTYVLTSVKDQGCPGAANGTALVDEMRILAEGLVWPVSCFGGTDGALSVNLSGDNPPFTYTWQPGLPAQLAHEQLSAGEYALQVTDARGCQKTISWLIAEPDPLAPVSVDCEALRRDDFVFSAQGGTPPYLYARPTGAWDAGEWLADLLPGQTYDIRVQDANGCEADFSWLAPAPFPDGMASLPPSLVLSLGERYPFQPEWLI
ncbi:MAG: choice-of-anchor L domain-containing protein, partial [Lewinella sp.]|nr:choice-of-anchor L domain-containing protein [Lewinella sp.]